MELALLKARTKAVETGVWVKGLTQDGLALKTRGANNADWRALSDKLWSEVAIEERANPAVRDRILSACIVETGLLDWNFTEGGKPVPFSKELAAELMEEHFIFRQAAIDATTSVQFQKVEALETDAKN